MQIGIELEYWLVDRNGDLASATEIAATCEGVDREFVDPLLEVKTPPCDSVEELVDVLRGRLERVRDVARSHDRRLVPVGTPLSDERPSECGESNVRIDIQRAVLGDDLDHARHCAGMHIHFEQRDVEEQLRILTAIDPAFALVNTAPYYRGRRIGACARPYVYRRLCYQSFPEHGQLWRYPESVAEWRRRTETRFEAFVDAARRNGVDRDTVTSAFSPHDAVWSPVRLRDDLGTVEWRAPDAAPPLSACRLAADVHRIVRTAVQDGTQVDRRDGSGLLSLPSFERLRENVDTAMERGLSAPAVERYLSRLGFDPDAYRPLGVRIDGPDRIDDRAARQFRRQYADRLEQDLRRLREEPYELIADAATPVAVR